MSNERFTGLALLRIHREFSSDVNDIKINSKINFNF